MTTTPWIHPAHGRVHLPTRHQRTVAAMHRVASAPHPTRCLGCRIWDGEVEGNAWAPCTCMLKFDATPEERVLLAIFGLRDGETPAQALADLRANHGRRSAA